MEFRLPDLGEGIDSATVVGVLVQPGDTVTSGQNVLAVETDKAALEVPISLAGTIGEIRVKPGDKIPVGGLILTLNVNGDVPRTSENHEAPTNPERAPDNDAPISEIAFKLPALGEGIDAATVVGVLVKVGDTVSAGQNVLAVETDKAALEVPVDVAGTIKAIHVNPGDKIPVGADVLAIEGRAATSPPVQSPATPTRLAPSKRPPATATRPGSRAAVAIASDDHTPAGPATRRLARELGVALKEVKGSGRGQRVTLDDIKDFIREERSRGRAGSLSGKTVAESFDHPPMPDFSKYGAVERKPVTGIRRKIAENLTVALRTMPTVTQHELADITELEAGRKKLGETAAKGSAKITWTVLAVKACVTALKEFPQFNTSLDLNAGELIYKKYFHIGIAVDTERGLLVPVIRNADTRSLADIAAEVAGLAEKARSGKLGLDDMRGGTFTITNLGGIGGTAFTPIVNYPEVAILGLSKSTLQPAVRDGKIVPRLLMPLSLTYDHRVIDGADGARFAARLAQLFGDAKLLLTGT